MTTRPPQTRGLFETVASPQDVELLAGLLLQGPIPPSAAVSGAVNPHAAASLLVYHLRDRVDGLLSKQAFARWLAIPSLEVSAQEKECQALVKALPRESSLLVALLFALLRSVAEEHAIYYKDGLNTRIMALSQLFGPLLLRPTKETEHPMACRSIQILVGKPMLVFIPASFNAPPAAAVPKIDMPGNKKLSAPPKTVSFRGDTPSIAERMDQKKSKKNQEVKGRQNDKSDEGYDSEGTNYNIGSKAHDPDQDSFLEMVACAPEEQVARELEGAMRGGPLLKYSSRGKPVAVMFFKLSQDASSLNWAPVTNPSDLKYGLLLDHVEEVHAHSHNLMLTYYFLSFCSQIVRQ